MIILQGRDSHAILNDLLAVFDFYNTRETTLWEASAHKSLQQILDLADIVLENPMIIADMSGNVLAMSSAFIDEDINEYWVESRDLKHVPTSILGAPLRTPDGELSSWTDIPQIYVMPDGTKTIGTYLNKDGESIVGFGLWEYKKPITPSDICLVSILYDVLLSTLDTRKHNVYFRSSSAILADLLAGIQVDEDLINNLEQKCKGPWQLLMIDNPFRSDIVYKRNLIQRLRTQEIPCIVLLYEDYIVTLVSEDSAPAILSSVLGTKEKQYYTAGLSLPFNNLHNVRTRYEQTLFAINQAGGKPGIYKSEEYALQLMLPLFIEQNKKQNLVHPVLDKLKQYDAEKNSKLYETLYQYLINERSILQGSQAMNIHKNTFMYRLQQIRSIIDVDFDNPMIRTYLLLSYLIDKS